MTVAVVVSVAKLLAEVPKARRLAPDTKFDQKFAMLLSVFQKCEAAVKIAT
jgi:hypothetical protein